MYPNRYTDFTNNIKQPIFINGTQVPNANAAKYLGMTLVVKLQWKEHIKKKRDELNIKFVKMYWMLGRNSELSIHNIIMLYKQVIRPVWSYDIQLWRCASDSNIQAIQCYQNKVLRRTVNAQWHVRNSYLHHDLRIKTVTDIIPDFANSRER
jgi:hypothetical protein